MPLYAVWNLALEHFLLFSTPYSSFLLPAALNVFLLLWWFSHNFFGSHSRSSHSSDCVSTWSLETSATASDLMKHVEQRGGSCLPKVGLCEWSRVISKLSVPKSISLLQGPGMVSRLQVRPRPRDAISLFFLWKKTPGDGGSRRCSGPSSVLGGTGSVGVLAPWLRKRRGVFRAKPGVL